MAQIDPFYWKLAVLCSLVGIFFFFLTTESLVQGKLKLPAWVFSSFTLVIGVFFFRIFVDSVGEFSKGTHPSLDNLLDVWRLVTNFIGIR
jgi:hypothetical protein